VQDAVSDYSQRNIRGGCFAAHPALCDDNPEKLEVPLMHFVGKCTFCRQEFIGLMGPASEHAVFPLGTLGPAVGASQWVSRIEEDKSSWAEWLDSLGLAKHLPHTVRIASVRTMLRDLGVLETLISSSTRGLILDFKARRASCFEEHHDQKVTSTMAEKSLQKTLTKYGLAYPFIMKRSGYSHGSGASIVNDPRDVWMFLPCMNDADTYQEALEGNAEVTVNVLVFAGQILDGIAYVFDHSQTLYIKYGRSGDTTRTSKTSMPLQNISRSGLEMVTEIAEKLAYTGILCIQYKDGMHSAKLIELMGRHCGSLKDHTLKSYRQQLAVAHMKLMSYPRITQASIQAWHGQQKKHL